MRVCVCVCACALCVVYTVERVVERWSWILIWKSVVRLAKRWTILLLGTNCRFGRVENTQIPVLEASRGPPRTPASRGKVRILWQAWRNEELRNKQFRKRLSRCRQRMREKKLWNLGETKKRDLRRRRHRNRQPSNRCKFDTLRFRTRKDAAAVCSINFRFFVYSAADRIAWVHQFQDDTANDEAARQNETHWKRMFRIERDTSKTKSQSRGQLNARAKYSNDRCSGQTLDSKHYVTGEANELVVFRSDYTETSHDILSNMNCLILSMGKRVLYRTNH